MIIESDYADRYYQRRWHQEERHLATGTLRQALEVLIRRAADGLPTSAEVAEIVERWDHRKPTQSAH